MQAIIVTGGKQYVVNEGDTLFIEKLPVEAGDAVTFDQVLAIVDGENTARARRSVSTSTRPRRAITSVRVIVSLIPRLRSARSPSKA